MSVRPGFGGVPAGASLAEHTVYHSAPEMMTSCDRAAIPERVPSAARALRATALLVGGVLACLAADGAQGACLKANADGQIAEGRLVTGRFRDAAGRREEAYILELTAPACLDGDDENDQVKGARRIHVYSQDDKLGAAMRRLVGKAVRITGNPFGQHTSHHHAPIVMEVAAIAPR